MKNSHNFSSSRKLMLAKVKLLNYKFYSHLNVYIELSIIKTKYFYFKY